MAVFKSFTYPSSAEGQPIHALACLPQGEVRGVVQIVHGIGEHIGRYRPFMGYLAAQGFAAVGEDHLGHGETAADEAAQGRFYPENGWDHVVRDLLALKEIIAPRYPGAPWILFGHSMGSFLARTMLIDAPECCDLAILSGTGNPGRLLLRFGNAVCRRYVARHGYDAPGEKLQKLAMGNYLKRIPHPRTPNDWQSRDEQEVDRFISDPLCHSIGKAGIYADMIGGIRRVTDPREAAKMAKELPLLFVSGAEDPVGGYGAEVRRAAALFEKAGVRDVTVKLYEGARHELLNETNRAEVQEEILEWIETKLTGRKEATA